MNGRFARRLAGHLLQILALAACYGQSTPVAAAQPLLPQINEILAHTDSPQVDAVELFNPGAAALDVGGWWLTDNADADPRLVIPSGTVIDAGGYLVIELDNDAPFRLSEFGETLFLYAPGSGAAPGPLADRAEFGISPNGVSFGPIVLSTGVVRQVLLQAVTLGAANALPRVGPLVIDEVMYRPAAGLAEYVAIRNAGNTPELLCAQFGAGQVLPSILRVDGDTAFSLPCGPLLEPGERLFIARAAPDDFRMQYGLDASVFVAGPFDGRLSNEGELVEIAWPQPPEVDGSIAYYALDQVEYGVATPWPVLPTEGISLVRRHLTAFGDDPANWRSSAAPPEAERVWLPQVVRG